MRALIFANHGIGDLLMAVPVIKALLQETSDRALIIVKSDIEAEILKLFDTNGQFASKTVQGGSQNKLFKFARLACAMRNFKPDTALLTHGIDPLKGGLLSLLSGAKKRIGPLEGKRFLFTHRVAKNPREHKVNYNCRLVRSAGRIPVGTIRANIPHNLIEESCKKFLKSIDSGWLGISLGSGIEESHKRLPEKIAVELIEKLVQQGFGDKIILFGTSQEKQLNHACEKVPGFSGINLSGKTSIAETMALLSRCRALISTCNGVSHLAASVGCLVIGLFGPTDPKVTGPFGTVLKIVCRDLDCSPCYKRGYIHGCGDPICMDIDIDEIIKEVKDI